ncbi:MAG: Spy/CpxP family protein refolding chaperone [Pseudomonadota bacterium]
MKTSHKHFIAAGLLALGFAATAQTPTPAPGAAPAASQAQGEHRGRHMDSAKMHKRMEERMARRHAALKQKLQLTPAQESAWTTFTGAMKPTGNMMQRPQRGEFEKLSTPERIDKMRAMRTARMAEMDKRAEATKTFYATLSPEQKKVFDAETARGHRGGMRHHHRG